MFFSLFYSLIIHRKWMVDIIPIRYIFITSPFFLKIQIQLLWRHRYFVLCMNRIFILSLKWRIKNRRSPMLAKPIWIISSWFFQLFCYKECSSFGVFSSNVWLFFILFVYWFEWEVERNCTENIFHIFTPDCRKIIKNLYKIKI